MVHPLQHIHLPMTMRNADTCGELLSARALAINILQKRQVWSLFAHRWDRHIQAQVFARALQHRQLELLQGIPQCHCTQVIMIVHERMLEVNCFYSLLCLTKISFLQSSLNIHLIRIALTYCGTLTREEGRDLRGGQEKNSDA